ncbi:hypothetical protein MBANPS3_012380 [Mucor bainieri]
MGKPTATKKTTAIKSNPTNKASNAIKKTANVKSTTSVKKIAGTKIAPAKANATKKATVTPEVQLKKRIAWKISDGGSDNMTAIGRLVHMLTEDGGTLLFQWLGGDNDGNPVGGDSRDTVASKIEQGFAKVGAVRSAKKIKERVARLVTDQYPKAYKMWKQSGEGVDDGDTTFEAKLNKLCPHFKMLMEHIGSRRTDPPLVMETTKPGETWRYREAHEINSDEEEDLRALGEVDDSDEEMYFDTLSDDDVPSGNAVTVIEPKLTATPQLKGKRNRRLQALDSKISSASALDLQVFIDTQKEIAAQKNRIQEYRARGEALERRIRLTAMNPYEAQYLIRQLDLEYGFGTREMTNDSSGAEDNPLAED